MHQQLQLEAMVYWKRWKESNRRWRTTTARVLTSPHMHRILILLIFIDVVFVLVELGYTLFNPNCSELEPRETPVWMEALSITSLALSALLVTEIPITVWCMGIQYFNPFGAVHWAALHLFDALINLATFILDLVLRGRERELASLLIILRLWRIAKLVSSVAVATDSLEEEVEARLEATKQELHRTKEELGKVEEEVFNLRQRLATFETKVVSNSAV
ncbi:hypothetical protein CC1G_04322 [Coprinopsis cinerea okayama7|uniref:Hydrogen voltage-gated channel 1 n=1 Tax=Coprinopsis cinerea (strain Okayama-7 / 130 / ATCC MYA-4618 / FGSC 9003) TaxID=240176 RepID=A8NFQ0_COPC7|nr:hypothetical protein CC1G_04322 [Coprinopsis cinerea okayama7\|eukprot:XP_001833343.2 hypothetical protein CC1G_04322 [Coprinopsis cinerea okayama7\